MNQLTDPSRNEPFSAAELLSKGTNQSNFDKANVDQYEDTSRMEEAY